MHNRSLNDIPESGLLGLASVPSRMNVVPTRTRKMSIITGRIPSSICSVTVMFDKSSVCGTVHDVLPKDFTCQDSGEPLQQIARQQSSFERSQPRSKSELYAVETNGVPHQPLRIVE